MKEKRKKGSEKFFLKVTGFSYSQSSFLEAKSKLYLKKAHYVLLYFHLKL